MDGRSIPFHRTLPTGIAHVRSLASAVLHLYAGCNTCGHGTRVKSGLFVCPVCEVLQCRKELTATKIP